MTSAEVRKEANDRTTIYCGRELSGHKRCREKVAEILDTCDGELTLYYPQRTMAKVMARIYHGIQSGAFYVRSNGVDISITDWPGELGSIAKDIQHWRTELNRQSRARGRAEDVELRRSQLEGQLDDSVGRLSEFVTSIEVQPSTTEAQALEQRRARILWEWCKVAQSTHRFLQAAFAGPRVVRKDPILVYCHCQSNRDNLIETDENEWKRIDELRKERRIIEDGPGVFDGLLLAIDPDSVRVAVANQKSVFAADILASGTTVTRLIRENSHHYCA